MTIEQKIQTKFGKIQKQLEGGVESHVNENENKS